MVDRGSLVTVWLVHQLAVLRRWTACSAVIATICLAMVHQAVGQVAPSRLAFSEAVCDLPALSPDTVPRLVCGTVAVPRDYAHPDRGTFNLAVVVVRSAQQPARLDPMVYISGGPGSPLTRYADYQARHPYAPARDLILVDQRGTGRSEPSLCPHASGDMLRATLMVAADPGPTSQGQRHAVLMACRDEARARGIDLDTFGTVTTVEDFDQVRQALGVAHWNVYGTSYGTTVAMTLMVRHPGTIRTAVLDSLYPPDPLPSWSARVAQSRDAFFAMCQADPACANSFPNLAGQYRQALARLGEAPPAIPVPKAMRQPGNRIGLTSSLFDVMLAQRLYYADAYPSLPRLIAAVGNGRTAEASSALGAVLAGAEALNMPVHIAVQCRDRPEFRNRVPEAADVLDSFQPYGICAQWSELGPPPLIPVGTSIPTLVLAGQFDPNLSLSLSQHVTTLIGGRATWIGFPLMGHHVRLTSPCAAEIASSFIDQPDWPPNTSCAQFAPLIAFLPS